MKDDKNIIQYDIEELIPIVKDLVDHYTSRESTSVPYTVANQLMDAVNYCIAAAFKEEHYSITPGQGISARQAYDTGVGCIIDKARKAQELYNEIMLNFDSYNVRCLEDTMVKGMPQFFLRYDVKFNPKDYILTLDYPVRGDIYKLEGIDRIYAYLLCIKKEQQLLREYPREYVISALKSYHSGYRNLFENIYELLTMYIHEEASTKKQP